jgi:hypothetical protein
MNDIIITLTTIPERLNSQYNVTFESCIESLLNQNFTEKYEVHVNIPKIYNKTGKKYIIPKWLASITDEKLKIYRPDDYGSITKLIPTLQRIKNKDAYIIVVDDDIVYHPELIKEHVTSRKQWPSYAVGYDGMRSRNIDGSFANNFNDSRDYYFSATGSNSLVDILQHYKSVSYVRSFFSNDFYEFIETFGTWCDDTSVSAYLAKHNIGRLCTYYKEDPLFELFDDYIVNVRHTFPITSHTDHGTDEGCNLERAINDESINKIYNNLFANFIDNGYKNNSWVV